MVALRKDVAGWPIAKWQEMFVKIYGPRNATWSKEILWHRMLEEIGELVVPMARFYIPDIQWQLPDIFAWLCAAATKISPTSLDDIVWAKFQKGCPRCKRYEDCSCPDVGQAISGTQLSEATGSRTGLFDVPKPSCLGEWQEFFGRLYGLRNVSSEPLFLLGRLTEDVGEVSRRLRLKRPNEEIEPRLASIFAWLCGICNRYSASYGEDNAFRLSEITYKKYHDTCAKCHESPCKCSLPLRTVFVSWPKSLREFAEILCTQIKQELGLEVTTAELPDTQPTFSVMLEVLRDIGKADACVVLMEGSAGLSTYLATLHASSTKGIENVILAARGNVHREASANALLREFSSERAVSEFSNAEDLVSTVSSWLSARMGDASE